MRYLTLSSILVFVFSITTPLAEAQFGGGALGGMNTTNTSAHLRVQPQYYEPNQTITIELNAYSLNTNGATISWFVDGTEQPTAQNDRSIQLTVGELGSAQAVQAVLTQPSGNRIPVSTTIRPVRIDLLVEADTLTPAFYSGRSLPSSGSTVRITALPFTGSGTNPKQFSYTWQINEDVLNGGARPGQNSVTFTPNFETAVSVRVTVLNPDGSTVATRSLTIPVVEPELHFYEINPLRGLQEVALSEDQIFQGAEMQVRAEPYYISRGLLHEDLHTEWKLNGRSLQNPSGDPQQIALRRQGTQGSFSLEFHIRNLNQLLQGVKDSITLRF